MTTATPETAHASAERTDSGEITEHATLLQENATLAMVLDAIPNYVAILDENRQIVAANDNLVGDFSPGQINQILGVRPGELLGCQNACTSPGGCGTTKACQTCGAVNAVLAAQNGDPATNDCQITTAVDHEALDLNISASPVQINGRPLTFLTVRHNADEKRRQVLEKTFFHDVLNASGGALGLAEALVEAETMEEVRELTPLLLSVTHQLVAEIQSQRELLAAEKGELVVHKEDVGSSQILLDVINTYSSHQAANGRHLVQDPDVINVSLHTSSPLLHRILGNMVKNALEATPTGGTVKLGCDTNGESLCFWVNNSKVMPQAVQFQVFNRSFSTKGAGRGIGTYSIRLLGEKYLGGQVSFDSNETQGTTFRICLPI